MEGNKNSLRRFRLWIPESERLIMTGKNIFNISLTTTANISLTTTANISLTTVWRYLEVFSSFYVGRSRELKN